MEVVKVIPSGYCKGVINAINKVKQAIKDYPDKQIYILGMLVHNRYVVGGFQLNNVITLSDKNKSKEQLLDDIDDGVVVFTAHGIDPKIKQKAIDKGLIVVDATCSDVTKNANLCLEHLKNGYDVAYIGKENHPESDAVLALNEKIHLITNINDVNNTDITNNKILITNQTTMSINDIETIINALLIKYPQAKVVEEICSATRTRQQAVKELKDFDVLIVVGDPNSNNTTQLANIGKQANIKNIYKIENSLELTSINLDNISKVAVTSGASTPNYLTQQVIDYLKTRDEQYLKVDLEKILDL
ncbi:MAG: 4-hydroxy-3-methylbut-2-enyl diphosphate reductase [Bacillota bacterium]|jgi:4-hydroxy-3-methylbut-2-enyl diphosphate reductase|nr:4-hydroxy-3-methylbut-2-enyl diphosphate reductase [Bacillota bacterium]NLL26877.1 4-hydroxy-3-methylbut-2-enyl diphosphate reductase [Erysipelotrichia bacterium]